MIKCKLSWSPVLAPKREDRLLVAKPKKTNGDFFTLRLSNLTPIETPICDFESLQNSIPVKRLREEAGPVKRLREEAVAENLLVRDGKRRPCSPCRVVDLHNHALSA
jgi:hypothetical protein